MTEHREAPAPVPEKDAVEDEIIEKDTEPGGSLESLEMTPEEERRLKVRGVRFCLAEVYLILPSPALSDASIGQLCRDPLISLPRFRI
jgi:hypothetical protein